MTTSQIAAADHITRAVGDVSRPLGRFAVERDLAHIPGESGTWVGVRNVFAASRHGVLHWCEQRER